jgi:glycerol-3-phosphate dehydrogenase
MMRNINNLADSKFDLLIIGGGIYGAALSWLATLAGLAVALIEKEDFGHATSANSQKVIHGGIRYLQNFDFARTRQSLRERRRLMHLAPHIVHPLPCLLPLYGHGFRGIEAMSLGLKIYDLIGKYRNKDSDPSKYIPEGSIISKSKICEFIPGINSSRIKGAAKWYDASCFNTERLVLAFIKSACRLGGVAFNYVKAEKILQHRKAGTIIKAHDRIKDEYIDIFAKNVINCCGPWIQDLLDSSSIRQKSGRIKHALGLNIITRKIFSHDMAVGLKNHHDRESGLYFVTPWRGKSIIGTEWFENETHPDNLVVDISHCKKLIDGFNAAYSPAKLTLNDVDHVHFGLVPCRKNTSNEKSNVNLINHFHLIDHKKDGLEGVITVIGVKYTTASDVAEKTLRYVFPNIKLTPIAESPQLIGGEIENFNAFNIEMYNKCKSQFQDEKQLSQVILNYGSETEKIIALGSGDESNYRKKDDVCDIIKGETLFAVREEMANKLSDVVLRRTQLGTAGRPSESDLKNVSILMAQELGWNERKRKSEISHVRSYYPSFLSS